MENIREVIQQESAKINKLFYKIEELVKKRDDSADGFMKWHEACFEFHGYVSKIDKYFTEESFIKLRNGDKLTVEFAIVFLEEDVHFFRSGYLKEEILKKLKYVSFDEKQKNRLCSVLIDAVKNRGCREYRRYCRLAKALGLYELKSDLELLLKSKDGSIKSRAKLMINYLSQ